MISGAARAEAAVLVIDAKEGVRENSRRHGYILSMLGIRQVVVCVNKMDLVKYDQDHFKKIEAEYRAFLEGIGAVSPRQFVPVAAVAGVNLATCGKRDPAYDGLMLLELLDTLPKAPSKSDQPLRMPLQAVYKFTEHGATTAGSSPGGSRPGRWRWVTRWSPRLVEQDLHHQEHRGVQRRPAHQRRRRLVDRVRALRGDLRDPRRGDEPRRTAAACLHADPDEISSGSARSLWFAGGGGQDQARHGGAAGAALEDQQGHRRYSQLDTRLEKDEVGRNDVADVILELRQPVAFDLTADCEATGRFVIVDGYDVAGFWIITAAVSDEARANLRAEARVARTSTGCPEVIPAPTGPPATGTARR